MVRDHKVAPTVGRKKMPAKHPKGRILFIK